MLWENCTSRIDGVNLIPFQVHGTLFKCMFGWMCPSSVDGKDEE